MLRETPLFLSAPRTSWLRDIVVSILELARIHHSSAHSALQASCDNNNNKSLLLQSTAFSSSFLHMPRILSTIIQADLLTLCRPCSNLRTHSFSSIIITYHSQIQNRNISLYLIHSIEIWKKKFVPKLSTYFSRLPLLALFLLHVQYYPCFAKL